MLVLTVLFQLNIQGSDSLAFVYIYYVRPYVSIVLLIFIYVISVVVIARCPTECLGHLYHIISN